MTCLTKSKPDRSFISLVVEEVLGIIGYVPQLILSKFSDTPYFTSPFA
jgi:hypothetical protein